MVIGVRVLILILVLRFLIKCVSADLEILARALISIFLKVCEKVKSVIKVLIKALAEKYLDLENSTD